MLESVHSTLPLQPSTGIRKLRLGFAGVGWIGRHRLNALAASGQVDVAAVVDPVAQAIDEVRQRCPGVHVVSSYEDLLSEKLDGVVIATPSAMHAEQAVAALERGIPVFCQKPLGRNAVETEAVISAARRADRLLGVDLSYRFTEGMRKIRGLIEQGELGEIMAIEAIFHNAYGPDKDWFYSRESAGGGCLLDLGIHLVDLALWTLDDPKVLQVSGWMHESDRGRAGDRVEDHAVGLLRLDEDVVLQLACSWGAHAGQDADIQLRFFGTKGGASFRNVGGSFFDFIAERFHPDRSREVLAEPPDAWGGRAITNWLTQLMESPRFCPDISHLTQVAVALDDLYFESSRTGS